MERYTVGNVPSDELGERILLAQPLFGGDRHEDFHVGTNGMPVMDGRSQHRRVTAMKRPQIGIVDMEPQLFFVSAADIKWWSLPDHALLEHH